MTKSSWKKRCATRLGAEFEIADLGTIRVKGKSQPIPVFAALECPSTTGTTGSSACAGAGPIFGRDREIALLQQSLTNLSPSKGG